MKAPTTTRKRKTPAQPRIRLQSAEEREVIEIFRCSSVKIRAALLTLMRYCDGSAFGDDTGGV